jgi:hypothetical protein
MSLSRNIQALVPKSFVAANSAKITDREDAMHFHALSICNFISFMDRRQLGNIA